MEDQLRKVGSVDVREKLCNERGLEIEYEDLLLIDYENNRFNIIKEKDLNGYR